MGQLFVRNVRWDPGSNSSQRRKCGSRKTITCANNSEPEHSQGATGGQAATCVSSNAESARDSSWCQDQHLAGMWGHVKERAQVKHRDHSQTGGSVLISLLSALNTELVTFTSVYQTTCIFLFAETKHLSETL